jgi:hypothetical protein
MGSCFSDRSKRYKGTGKGGDTVSGSLDEVVLANGLNSMNTLNGMGSVLMKSSVIKIKQNPNTSKLQGVPRKLVDNGYFNRQIVEMDKIVDDEPPG